MKRTLVLSAVAVLLLSAVSVFVYVNNEKNHMDDLFRANVEVLARNEGGSFGSMCSQTGTSGSYYMKLCSSCSSFGHFAIDAVAFCN